MGLLARFYRKLSPLEQKLLDSNQFLLMHVLGILYGIRFDSSKELIHRTLWYCYRSALFFLFGTYCYKIYWHLMQPVYSFSLFHVLGTLWILAGSLIRVIIYDRPVLIRLEQFLNDDSFRGDEHEVRTARRLIQRWNNRYVALIAGALLLETVMFLTVNLMFESEFMLEFKGHIVGGLAIQLVYGFATCCCGSIYVIVFTFIYAMLNVFRQEMIILVDSFGRINECFRERRSILNADATSITMEQKFWKELRDLLKKNVQRHVDLLEHLSAFRSILAPFSLVQYYGSFVLIAHYTFMIAYHGITNLTMVYVGFFGFMVVESFLFSRNIHILNDLHAKVGSTLYELEWYDQLRFSARFASDYRQVRTSLLIIMIRTQTTLRFNLSGQGTISMSWFVDLINSSYSFLCLLWQYRNLVEPK